MWRRTIPREEWDQSRVSVRVVLDRLRVTVRVQGSVWEVRRHHKDTLLNKDLACDLLCKTSAESGLTVSNFSGISDRVPERRCSSRDAGVTHLPVKSAA